MPGPDNIFVLTESVSKGHKTGVAIAVGLCVGIIVHTTLAATGLSLILMQSDIAFALIKYLGAGYLLYLAYQASRDTTGTLALADQQSAQPFRALPLIRKGFLMNVLNPKVSLFFIAFLPQFIRTDSALPPAWQMILLGLIFMAQALVIFSGIALLSGRLTPFVTQPKFWHLTKWLTVVVLAGLAVSLAISTR